MSEIHRDNVIPTTDKVHGRPSDDELRPLVTTLIKEGYSPFHWARGRKGLRADDGGALMVPSHCTSRHACMVHGNLARPRGNARQGVKGRMWILDVLPCLFCDPDAVHKIKNASKARSLR